MFEWNMSFATENTRKSPLKSLSKLFHKSFRETWQNIYIDTFIVLSVQRSSQIQP